MVKMVFLYLLSCTSDHHWYDTSNDVWEYWHIVLNDFQFFEEMSKEYHTALDNLKRASDSILSYQELFPDKKNALFWQMTLDFGRRYMQMYLDWIENCMDLLADMEEGQ